MKQQAEPKSEFAYLEAQKVKILRKLDRMLRTRKMLKKDFAAKMGVSTVLLLGSAQPAKVPLAEIARKNCRGVQTED